MVYCGVYDNALDDDNYNLAKGFNYHQGPVSVTTTCSHTHCRCVSSTRTQAATCAGVSVMEEEDEEEGRAEDACRCQAGPDAHKARPSALSGVDLSGVDLPGASRVS